MYQLPSDYAKPEILVAREQCSDISRKKKINHLYTHWQSWRYFSCTETVKYQNVKSTGKAEMLPNWTGSGSYSSKWSAIIFLELCQKSLFSSSGSLNRSVEHEEQAHGFACRVLNLNCCRGQRGVMAALRGEHLFSLTAELSVPQLQAVVPPKGVLGMVWWRLWSVLCPWRNSQLPLIADCTQYFQGRGLRIYISDQ